MLENKDQQSNSAETANKKLILGSIILIIGFLAPLLIPLVTSSSLPLIWKSTISGFLALGIPELFMLIAIAIMGKEGYDKIKASVLRFLKKHGPPQEVSKTRYRIGILMFTMILIIGFALPYLLSHIDWLKNHLLTITLGSDLILLISIWILGGDFWDKLSSLFIYNSKAVFNTKE